MTHHHGQAQEDWCCAFAPPTTIQSQPARQLAQHPSWPSSTKCCGTMSPASGCAQGHSFFKAHHLFCSTICHPSLIKLYFVLAPMSSSKMKKENAPQSSWGALLCHVAPLWESHAVAGLLNEQLLHLPTKVCTDPPSLTEVVFLCQCSLPCVSCT